MSFDDEYVRLFKADENIVPGAVVYCKSGKSVSSIEGETMSFVRERERERHSKSEWLTLGQKTDAIVNLCRELGMGVTSMSHSIEMGDSMRINIEIIVPVKKLYGDIWKDDPNHTIPELDIPPTEKELEEEKGII